jgi:P27 family predicted phage terminase small subunit
MSELEPPGYLNQDGRRIWADYAREILTAGTVATVNASRLAELVSAVQRHQRATALIAQTDILIQGKPGETPRENPAVKVQAQAARVIATLRKEFGLTRRVLTPKPGQNPTPDQGRWCGEHKRWECIAHRKNGDDCHQTRLPAGHNRCYMHVGVKLSEDPKHILAVERKRNPLAGEPMDIAPGPALLWRVKVYAGEVRRLDAAIAELDADELVWGDMEVTTEESDAPVRRVKEGARIHSLLILRAYRERQLHSACEAALHAGIEQQLVDLQRDQVAFMKAVIVKALWEFAGIREDDPRVTAELPALITGMAG